MRMRNRITSVILVISMIIGLVFSSLFIFENSEHKCTGADCQICAQVNSSLKAFNNQTQKPKSALSIISVFWAVVLILGYKNNKI